MQIGLPTHDQIRIFLAVVDEGSFNAAAKRLNRAISAISYGIAGLEAQIGQSVFAREGSSRPVLTPAGQAILAQARTIRDDMDALVAKARSFSEGLESRVTLVIDVMYPSAALARVLREFYEAFPTVDLILRVEALGAVRALIDTGEADIGVSGPLLSQIGSTDQRVIGEVELVQVAAPSHPLARRDKTQPGDARNHIQIVLTDRSRLTEGLDFSVLATRTWRLADLGAKHALLLEGIGWGSMPRQMVAEDLARGRLVELEVPEIGRIAYPLTAIWRRDRLPGPAREWLLDALRAACTAFA